MRRKVAYERLDDAIVRLRRLWSTSTTRPVDGVGWPGVDLSTVLVADAVHRLAAASGPEATVAAVAARLAVTPSTASRLVDRAVAAGAVDRSRSDRDARRVVLHLTERGERLVEEAARFRQAFLGRALAGWPARDVATLAELLARFADDVQHTTPAPPEGEETT